MAAKSFMSLMKTVVLRTCETDELDAARRLEMLDRTCFYCQPGSQGYQGCNTHSLSLDSALDDLHGLGVEGNRARSVDQLEISAELRRSCTANVLHCA
jgi:hypothetical protein